MPATPTDPPSSEVLRYAAFTERGAGGNPAGVVLDARGLTDAQMLAVAATSGTPRPPSSPAARRPTT